MLQGKPYAVSVEIYVVLMEAGIPAFRHGECQLENKLESVLKGEES